MDVGLSRDIFDSFVEYQKRMKKAFMSMQRSYRFQVIDGEQSSDAVYDELIRGVNQAIFGA